MNRSNHHHSAAVGKKATAGLKRPIKVSPLELTLLSDVNIDGEGLDLINPNYQSELEYDGYQSIEDYDNHSFHMEAEGGEHPEKELNFDDDASDEDEEDTDEDSVDSEENRR